MNPPILISYPCGDMVHADFTHCLSLMMLYSCMRAGIEVGSSQVRTSIICSSRNAQVQQFLEAREPFSHMLFLDSDMTFPFDTLQRLLSHRRAIVGASYCMRIPPRGMTHRDVNFSSRLPDLGEHEGNIYPVLSMGMGCVLVAREVFETLAKEDVPFFQVHYQGKKLMYGEDGHFFRRANHAGIPAFCDIALSYELGHVGQKAFTPKDVEITFSKTDPDMIAVPLPGLGNPASEEPNLP